MTTNHEVVEQLLTRPSMVSPTLFVGLGGCGCRIAVRVAQHLKERPDYAERYKDLVKVALVDTNVNDLERYREDADETFLISDFEKAEYANLAGGKLFLEADDYFTHWVPEDYRFRAGDTAGAGQIRIESRLGCYYQMKHGDFVARFRRLLEQIKSHEHGHRRLDSQEIRIVICYSVAGGTGSGSHLPIAYMLRDQARALGKPSLIGVSVLPSVFEDKTGANKDGTYANGYAALKEVEHLMKLGAPESRFFPEDGVEFHYDPSDASKRRVHERPFEFVYVIDKPESFTVTDPIGAAADGLYLQFFSPLFAEQAGDYDNYTQHQRFLVPHDFEAKGITGYTQFYGSFGAAVLLVPVPDLVRYCAESTALSLIEQSFLGSIPGEPVYRSLRESADAFYQVKDADDDDARTVDLAEFHKKEESERKRLRDRLFQKRVRLLAACETSEDAAARFTAIFRHGHRLGAQPTTQGGFGYEPDTAQRQREFLAKDGMGYSIGALVLEALIGENPERPFPGLLQAAKHDMKTKASNDAASFPIQGKMTVAALKNRASGYVAELERIGERRVKNGYQRYQIDYPGLDDLRDLEFLEKDAAGVDLTAQRYAILCALDELTGDVGEPGEPAGFEVLDHDDDDKLKEDEARGVLESLYDQAVERAFWRAQKLFLEARTTIRDQLARTADLLRGMEVSFDDFRDDQRAAIERARNNPPKASAANQYILDAEALQMENGRRMWDFYYEDRIAPLGRFSLREPEIQKRISGTVRQMMLRGGSGTRAQLRGLYESLRDWAADELETIIGGEPKANDREKRYGLTLADALKLEVEYRMLYQLNLEEIGQRGTKAIRNALAEYRARPENRIDFAQELHQDYIRDKIKRVVREKSDLLCSYDESRDQHGGVRPNYVFLGAINEHFDAGGIEQAIRTAEIEGIKWVKEGWDDPHKIIFYKSVLNVPLYVFGRMGEMKDFYYRFKHLAKRSKVLHIDKNWEETLPDLDPDGAQEKHRQAKVREHIINFGVLLTMEDPFRHGQSYIVHRNGKYYLRPPHPTPGDDSHPDDHQTALGGSLTEAIERLPEVIDSERVKYHAFQQVLQGVQHGLSPLILEKVVRLPFRWRKNRDQLRTQYGTDPAPDQQLKLKDYTDSFQRMTEALESLLDRLRYIEAEMNTVGGDHSLDGFGMGERQLKSNLRQSIELLRGFQDGWRSLEHPEESTNVPSDFRNLFDPLAEDELKDTLEVLRSGEIDRDAYRRRGATSSAGKPGPARRRLDPSPLVDDVAGEAPDETPDEGQ